MNTEYPLVGKVLGMDVSDETVAAAIIGTKAHFRRIGTIATDIFQINPEDCPADYQYPFWFGEEQIEFEKEN